MCVALSVAVITLDYRYHYLDYIRFALLTIVSPLQFAVNLPIDMAEWLSARMLAHNKLIEKNQQLQREHLRLNQRLQRFTILEKENQRLRKLLESSLKMSERSMIAELLEVDMQPFRQRIVIDKGEQAGAYNGQPVVDANGIVGQIIHVGPLSSTVLLITDQAHALPVQLNRNGLRAIALGIGSEDVLQLAYLPNDADVREGDLVISSGLGQRFPKGYPVGAVTEIKLDPSDPFAKIKMRPSAQLRHSNEVLIIWPN